ncbi:MAG: hypothetical protein IH840_05250 [Candidatus Heimdallarchaeota archaeon]|nr:hypothetical protein [Candidatus Heimdallarchaeota archaeon]
MSRRFVSKENYEEGLKVFRTTEQYKAKFHDLQNIKASTDRILDLIESGINALPPEQQTFIRKSVGQQARRTGSP